MTLHEPIKIKSRFLEEDLKGSKAVCYPLRPVVRLDWSYFATGLDNMVTSWLRWESGDVSREMAFEIEEREHLQYFRYGVVGFPDLIRGEPNWLLRSDIERFDQVLLVCNIGWNFCL